MTSRLLHPPQIPIDPEELSGTAEPTYTVPCPYCAEKRRAPQGRRAPPPGWRSCQACLGKAVLSRDGVVRVLVKGAVRIVFGGQLTPREQLLFEHARREHDIALLTLLERAEALQARLDQYGFL